MNDYYVGINVFFKELWNLFLVFNNNYSNIDGYSLSGFKFSTGLILSFFLFVIIKIKATTTFKKEYIVAMIGALLIVLKYIILLVFEWGFQIKLYTDLRLYHAYPMLENFFFMMGLGCLAYYTLNYIKYYPGVLKRILPFIPIFICIFFILNVNQCVNYYDDNFKINEMMSQHKLCFISWKNHVIIWLMSLYVTSVYSFKKKYKDFMFLSWVLILLEESLKIIYIYNFFVLNNTNCCSLIPTIFNASQLLILLTMSYFFVKLYSKRDIKYETYYYYR